MGIDLAGADAQWVPPLDEDRYAWRMTVRDALDRERELHVFARGGRVVLRGPEPGTCSLDPDQGDTLSAAIQGASDRARRQRRAES